MCQSTYHKLCILVIIAAGICAYLTSFQGVFIADDGFAITENPNIRHIWPPWNAMKKPPIYDTPVRPVVYFSFAVNYALGGLNTFGYHVFNLAVHILAGLVLYGIVRRTLLADALKERFGEVSTPCALVTVLLWIAHPLQTQSVTYIAQRAESMMGLLYLLCLYFMILGVSSQKWGKWYFASIACCALGMGCKPVIATAPLMVLIYDRCFISGSFKESLIRRRIFYSVLFISTLGLLAAIIVVSPRGEYSSAGFTNDFTPIEYALNQGPVILHYLKLTLWPYPQCLDYVWQAAKDVPSLLVPCIVIGSLFLVAAAAFVKRSVFGFLGAWFFLILMPTSSFIPIDDLAVEHRMYLPLAALCALAACGGWRLLCRFISSRNTRRKTVVGSTVILLFILGTMTARRNMAYHSDEGMFRDVVATRPQNHRAHYGLGRILYGQGKVEEAIKHYKEAIGIKQDFPFPYTSIGIALMRQGEFGQAIMNFDKAIDLHPDYAGIYINKGFALVQIGRIDDAILNFKKAIELNPEFAEAYNNLGIAYIRKDDLKEAVGSFHKALAIDPDHNEAKKNLQRLKDR